MEDSARRWWLPNEDDDNDEAHRSALLLDETAGIEQRQAAWYELNLWNTTLYTNRELIGFRWGADSDAELWPTNLRTENLIENIGEAMLSKASSSPIKPTLQPHGNSYKVEKAIRVLDKFLYGVWRQTDCEDAAVQSFGDAFKAGLGCVRVAFDRHTKALHVEPVFFDNLVIDNRECANRAPPRTHRIRTVVPRASVEARYGCELGEQKGYAPYRQVGDGYVVLVEAWRLPDSEGNGGRHTIACCGKLILDEEWSHDWVPLVYFHWQDRTSGFFVKSGVEQLVPYQVRQNELNDDIKSAQDLGCRMRLLLQANSMIDVSQWDSEQGRFLMYSGTPPIPFEWKTNLTELYQERIANKSAAYSHMGLSEMFANADVPNQVRMDSSAGIREVRNMEDGRHLRLWTMFQTFRLNVAKTAIKVLSISKGADAFTSVYHPARATMPLETIEFRAVKELLKHKFSWTLEATPLSQMSPAARRELIRDYSSRGRLKEGAEESQRLESTINMDRLEALELASEDDILRHLEIIEEGGYEAPTELTNTTMGITLFTANYHRLMRYEDVTADDEMMQNHIRWITHAAAIQVAATQPQQAPMSPFAPTQGMAGTHAGQSSPGAGM